MRGHFDELRQEADWLRTGCYPEFVTARAPQALVQDVPVFVFHSIEHVEFATQLRIPRRKRLRYS